MSIREDTKGRILLTGLHQVSINSIDDLLNALNFGSSIRQTDATNMNAKSSRSHAVFSLQLIQRKSQQSVMSPKEKRMSVPVEAMSGNENFVTIDSKLHFVDLAGSERLKNTGASGDRAKEGISINAGLASLGKVISQLSSRQAGSHVSYRDSKLTRLLQDSLGGNAITYMIACVTPAEFHLSETLNTVQYAQRARAIQSKPRIQQVSDDSDKQAVIERLRAEVSFLRLQIRSTEGAERRVGAPQERPDRQNEREIDLQNHLLDVQESYTALSQRHAKLISELTKGGDSSIDLPDLNGMIGDNAVERLKRSHSFAESVEAVVLEYEKTIQSLESSLSQTRSSLSNTESNLLERETKCAYVETVNQQLQSRVQKMMDREANTEHYLHDLEAKLDGHTSGEEKNSAIVAELRKEIARVRENEASCEDYISTLEERLAEADQDMELMQREVERLEHVVERQRSVGKLDNLLYELDNIQQTGGKRDNDEQFPNVVTSMRAERELSRQRSLQDLEVAREIAIPEESDEDLVDSPIGASPIDTPEEADDGLEDLKKATAAKLEPIHTQDPQRLAVKNDYPPQSPAQSKYVADKLEDVTQELFDLRVEHESTLNDYETLNARYQIALRTLAELQDSVDEARHNDTVPTIVSAETISRPVSFLEDARINEIKNGGHLQSSRSLSSELSLAGESPFSMVQSNVTAVSQKRNSAEAAQKELAFSPDAEILQKMLGEHEQGLNLVTQQYAQLEAEHEDTLDIVEELKAELQRAKMSAPTSPTNLQPVIRRMTSQNVMPVDRAHRAIASMRNVAVEEFEARPDTMQIFEMNLNTCMNELHSRMERIQSLEAENKSVKKEMEAKAQMISGLTRERSSLKGSSPMDISVVSSMREQMLQNEDKIKTLQDSSEARERDLLAQIDLLNESINAHKETWIAKDAATGEATSQQNQRLAVLEKDLEQWQDKHRSAVESTHASEKQLSTTLAELTAATASIDAMHAQHSHNADASAEERDSAAGAMDNERSKHHELVEGLKRDIEHHKSTIASHTAKIGELERSHSDARAQLEQHSKDLALKDVELEKDRQRGYQLEQEIEEHKSAIAFHKHGLKTLHDVRDREIQELRNSQEAAAKVQADSHIAEQASRHEHVVKALRNEIEKSRNELKNLLDGAGNLLKQPTSTGKLNSQIRDLLNDKAHATEFNAQLQATNEELEKQLHGRHGEYANLEKQVAIGNGKLAEHQQRIRDLAMEIANHEETLREKDETIRKRDSVITSINAEKKNSARIIEELEQQIESSFDQHTNRLSAIQESGSFALAEANNKIGILEKELDGHRNKVEQLEVSTFLPTIVSHLNEQFQAQQYQSQRPSGTQSPDPYMGRERSNSNSNLRKSASAASLPSPPPAIPLPPLPMMPSIASATNGTSPPQSRHASKELVSNSQQAQLIEDQEARIRTIEKHLHAEKQLTATLEEALVDLETQSNKVKQDMEAWKKKAWSAEEEIQGMRKERKTERLSIQAVEEERNARREAEAARAHLEERMNALSRKKKKSTLNCF